MGAPRLLSRWGRRLGVSLAALAATPVVLELVARALSLDEKQAEAIAIDVGRERSAQTGRALGWDTTAARLGLDYLPEPFTLDDAGFTTRWGRCAFGFTGPSVLVVGDSTTKQSLVQVDGVWRGEDPRDSWPAHLQQDLGPGVQVCVAAEDGYHPRDEAPLVEHLAGALRPVVTVVLLCPNDLVDADGRTRVETGDRLRLAAAAPYRLVYAPLAWPWGLDHSEALRFVAWRLASADPARALRIATSGPPTSVAALLRRMDAAPGALRLFFLPVLDDDLPALDPRVPALASASGLPIPLIDLPGPRAARRRTPTDTVHPDAEGNVRIEAAVLAAVRPLLPG